MYASENLTKYYDPWQCYPFNLLKDMFRPDHEELAFYLPGIETALNTLTEREQYIIILRYRDGETLQTVSEYLGLTRERVRQIETRAILRLRHPDRSKFFLSVSPEEVEELKAENTALQEKNFQLMQKVQATAQIKGELEKQPISALELSTRSTNCLLRSHCETIGDVSKLSYSDLMQIKNLGSKSAREIIAAMNRCGIQMDL